MVESNNDSDYQVIDHGDNSSNSTDGRIENVLVVSTPPANMDEREMADYSESWRTYQEQRLNVEADDSSESENETATSDENVDASECPEPVPMHPGNFHSIISQIFAHFSIQLNMSFFFIDPRMNAALNVLIDMGFKNDDGSLTELLEMVNGNITDVLQLMEPFQ